MTTTNVLQIPGFSQIPYRIFILPPTSAKSTSAPTTLANDLRRAQIALLRRGELANFKNGELWTFSRDGAQSAAVPDESTGLQEISTGTLFASQLLPLNESPPQSAGTQTLRNGAAHDHFLSSVRALIEFRFLQLPGYNILGSWLVPPSTDDDGNDGFRSLLPALLPPSKQRDMFRLSVNLATNGDLYITPESNATVSIQLLNASQPPSEGSTLYLSPSGLSAEFLSTLPSTPQTTSILQKIRSMTGLEANFPLIKVHLPSGSETLWPANLTFQRSSNKTSPNNNIDYFNLKDGVSSAVKLIADALTYKPPPAPSPAIPPAIAANVTPNGVYHTPPDGVARPKPVPTTAPTPTVSQAMQDEWNIPVKDEDFWPSVGDTRGDDEDFNFNGMDEGFDLREEDFNFFDDEPSGEFDAADALVSDIPPPEEQVHVASEEMTQPMEDIKTEQPETPVLPPVEPNHVLSPPESPLRILPSPPPTRKGSVPKTWDHVRLSGNLEQIHNKYRRGGKYWCDELDEEAATDDSVSSSSSDDEGMEWISANPRKRKRDGDEGGHSHKLSTSSLSGGQALDAETISTMSRAIIENMLFLPSVRDGLFNSSPQNQDKFVDYANGLDNGAFSALVEVVANQVAWDGLNLSDEGSKPQEMRMDDFFSVVSGIWGADAPNNPGLKDLTEATDAIPSFEEEDSPQIKTPRMKATKSSHSQNPSFSLVSNVEQTSSIYPISAPSFLVHRIINRNPPAPNMVQRLSVSPPALRFWEKFSFSPVAGEKDLRCYVVHPDSEGMSTAVDIFLSEIQTAWETCGMGKFERGKVKEDGGRDGMITINVPPGADEEMCLAAYQDVLVNFGRVLSKMPNSWLKNIVLLVVNPFPSGSAVIPLCRAFLSFKTAFFEGMDNPALVPPSNVALQIVPVSMVAQKEGVVIRGLEFQSFLRRLYDRCEVMENTVATTSRGREFVTSPATLLASPPPGTLEFTDSFPAQHRSLLKDDSSLHVAYSISADNRWVTAVWTDDWGQVSLKESYCLSRLTPSVGGGAAKPQTVQSFERACAQMWLRTLQIAKEARINWKIIIVRVGGMSSHELKIWNAIKEGNSQIPGRIQLILACIDLHPPLALSVLNSGPVVASPVASMSTPFPSSTATFSQSSPAAIGNAYGTPVATPLAQANESPDPSGGIMSTPGGTANAEATTEFDPEARWVDAADEVWAIVLNHRVPACPDTEADSEIRFALASGFLWPVHLLHVDKPQPISSPPPETLPSNYARDKLKQLLAQYRGLASLGDARGVSSSEKVVPWHVIAAERMKDVFSGYM